MTNNNQEQIALANNGLTYSQGYRPRLIEFYGYEGEDFRHFQEILESYIAISNTNNNARKLVILKSQLRRAAKVFFERVILKENPDVGYDQAMELLRKHYITAELIQSYELEFNEMFQGEQEHPQIFLSRLREAADLANITSEPVVESRFRAGLLKEIKQFCIQSSAREFKDWINHADGWWNANRPRKIAMVDNPFIPRNVNNALIYKEDNTYNGRHSMNNHNIELVDTNDRPGQVLPINDIRTSGSLDTLHTLPHVIPGLYQLTTMEVMGNSNNQQYPYQLNGTNGTSITQPDSQKNLVNLIQQAIRRELNTQQYQPYQNPRNYNRRNRYDNQYQNGNDGGYHNNYKGNSGYRNNNGSYDGNSRYIQERSDYGNQDQYRNSPNYQNNRSNQPQNSQPLQHNQSKN